MASSVQTARAVGSIRKWERAEHLRNYRSSALLPLVDPSGRVLVGITGCRGVRACRDDGAWFGCDFIALQPGSGFPQHTHVGDHILYIIAGQGFVHIDGEDIAVDAGHVIHIPAEYPHRVFTTDHFLLIAATGHPHAEIDSKERMSLVT